MVREAVPFFQATSRQPRKICFLLGTRSDYALLRPVLLELRQRTDVSTQQVVSNLGTGETLGSICRALEGDGLSVDERIDVRPGSNTAAAACGALGLALIHLGSWFGRQAPNLVVVIGDRADALAAAVAARTSGIPIAHVRGSKLALADEASGLAPAISALSDLHLASTADDRLDAVRHGAEADRVFHVGALEVENALSATILDREVVCDRLGLPRAARFVVVPLQATSRESDVSDPSPSALTSLFTALDRFPDLIKVVVGRPGEPDTPDFDGAIGAAAAGRADYRLFHALGNALFMSAVRCAEIVVTDVAADVVALPSLAVPLVFFGPSSQRWALLPSIVSCEPSPDALGHAMDQGLSLAARAAATRAENPYELQGTAVAIAEILTGVPLARPAHDVDLGGPGGGTDLGVERSRSTR